MERLKNDLPQLTQNIEICRSLAEREFSSLVVTYGNMLLMLKKSLILMKRNSQ